MPTYSSNTHILQVRDGWQRMHPDIAKKGCLLLDTDPSPEVEICCDMEVLINQLNILTDASTALLSHSVRLIMLKDLPHSSAGEGCNMTPILNYNLCMASPFLNAI